MAELKRRRQPQPQPPKDTLDDSRQTSPNPAVQAMQNLMGGGGMSKPTDAPAPDKLSEPLRTAAEKVTVPENAVRTDSEQVSPVSTASVGTADGSALANSLTATASASSVSGPEFVAEPASMTQGADHSNNENSRATDEQDSRQAFSYPGLPQSEPNQDSTPSRRMSLPGYGQSSPKSPASNNKRHKCPYCATDFTRHHNLKSHLLTHSQEKPYGCTTCNARFRRLHDLKRHTKLHTGERPHTCDKCGRRFARGDALARHNKGPGGCAGRRSSFGGDDDYGAEVMDGIEYTGGDDDDDDGTGAEQNGRRISEPSRKRQQLETPRDTNRDVYRQYSSTYPPPPSRSMRGSVGGMAPPTVVHPGSSTDTSPREMPGQSSQVGGSSINSTYYGQPGQMFAEPGTMTQSPRPLSPGQPPDQHRLSVTDPNGPGSLGRNRSTSLTTQFQQQHFGRGSTGRTPPPSGGQFSSNPQGAPVLPPLGSGSQSQPRTPFAPTSLSGGLGSSMLSHQQISNAGGGGPGSNPGSLSSHGQSSGSSHMRDIAGSHESGDIWVMVRQLEQRFSRMQDEYELRISRLQEEVISLKSQLTNTASYSSEMSQRY